MADVITKLVVDNKEFLQKIGLSKNEFEKLKDSGSKLGSGLGSLTSIVSKFAVGIGVVTTAEGVFNGMLKNSASMARAYGTAQAEGTAAINTFFSAIANGNFRPLLDGLSNVIDKAKKAYVTMIQLRSTLGSNSIGKAVIEDKEARLKARIKNNPNDTKGNDRARAEIKQLEKERQRLTHYNSNAGVAAGLAGYNLLLAEHGGPKYNSFNDYYTMWGNSERVAKQKKKYKQEESEIEKNTRKKTIKLRTDTGYDYQTVTVENAKAKKIKNSNGYRQRQAYFATPKGSGSDWEGYTNNIVAGIDEDTQSYNINAKWGKIVNGGKTKEKKQKVEKSPEQKAIEAIQYDEKKLNTNTPKGIDKYIADIKNLQQYRDGDNAIELEKKIKGLEGKKLKIGLEFDEATAINSLEDIQKRIADNQKIISNSDSDTERVAAQERINSLKKDEWNVSLKIADNDNSEEGIRKSIALINEGILNGYNTENQTIDGVVTSVGTIKKLKEQLYNKQLELIDKERDEAYIGADLSDKLQADLTADEKRLKIETDLTKQKELQAAIKQDKEKIVNNNYQSAHNNNDGSLNGYSNEISALNAKIGEETDPSKIIELGKQLDELQKKANRLQLDKIGKMQADLGDVSQAVGDVGDSFSSMNSMIKDFGGAGSEKVAKFFDGIQSGINVFNELGNAIRSVSNVIKMFTKTQNIATLANTKKSASNVEEASTATAAAAATGVKATMNTVEAATNAGATTVSATKSTANLMEGKTSFIAGIGNIIKSFTAMGPIGYILMGAAIAGTIALFASAMGAFADGGIIGGSLTSGDRQTVRVNAGEMILNQRQQSTLFKAIHDGNIGGNGGGIGQVEFKLRGTDLIGLAKNYDKKIGKIR